MVIKVATVALMKAGVVTTAHLVVAAHNRSRNICGRKRSYSKYIRMRMFSLLLLVADAPNTADSDYSYSTTSRC